MVTERLVYSQIMYGPQQRPIDRLFGGRSWIDQAHHA